MKFAFTFGATLVVLVSLLPRTDSRAVRTRSRVRSPIVASASTSSATRFTNLLPASAPVPLLTDSQRARTLGAGAQRGVFSTIQDQFPFSAPLDYVLNERGEPVFMLKAGSPTAVNIGLNPQSSLLVVHSTGSQLVTLLGSVVPLPEQEFAQSHVDFLNVHHVAKECIGAGGFSLFKLVVDKCFLQDNGADTAGKWLATEQYAEASIDALAPFSRAIMTSVNGPKRADLRRFSEAYFAQPLASCELVDLDELGFEVEIAQTAGGAKERRRIGFNSPRRSDQEARSLFIKTFFQAWSDAEPAPQPGSDL